MEDVRLSDHLRDRPTQLLAEKEKGKKIVGYLPGNYVPEEIIYASGAIPVCLAQSGASNSDTAALSVVPHIICPFARAQIGEQILKTNPYHTMVDMIVAPITCQHIKKAAEILEYFEEVKIFKLGVPHQYEFDFEVEYYADRLRALKDTMQELTGNKVTEESLANAIEIYNTIRDLLKKISLLRRFETPDFNTIDFFKLNQASLYADPVFMVDLLTSIYGKLKDRQSVVESHVPRIMLIGPNIAYDDYKILELTESAGGNIVIEEVCEGLRYYWNTIEKGKDLFQCLARGYLVDRVPGAFLRDTAKKRLDFAISKIGEFNVYGVIWYELLNCETYDSESYYFDQELSKRNIPVLILGADYGTSDTEHLKMRVSAFIEMMKGI